MLPQAETANNAGDHVTRVNEHRAEPLSSAATITSRIDEDALAFGAASQRLSTIASTLDTLMAVFKATAWVGVAGELAAAQVSGMIVPHVQWLAGCCAELHNELRGAADTASPLGEPSETRKQRAQSVRRSFGTEPPL